MTFFLDENLSFRFAEALRALKRDVIHLTEKYGGGTKDEAWLSELSKHGWFLLTQDRKILSRPHELVILQEKRITAFFIAPFFADTRFWDQAVWLITHWTKFEGIASAIEPGNSFIVLKSGKMKPLPRIKVGPTT